MDPIIPSGNNANNASSDGFDQSSTSVESAQLSEEWTDDIVETFERQGITLEEVEDTRIPETSTDTNILAIPVTLKGEAEKGEAKVFKMKWEDLPDNIKDWIKAHPYQTAFHVVSGVVFFAPAAASGPVLYLLGFGSMGPRAASFATFWHSKIGVVVAKSGFSFMQSAGMGGYAAAAVNTAVQASAAVSSLGAGFWGWARGSGDR
ncbi:uncharacterized protein EAF01_006507 [Botrytis porri]|uniref:Uncharacterized protein n=1 Tax=Botrytis porri TaxID=87229 RepID=A0A4Z1KSL3_9HELO|nr:uncharacterized protein EAF01_006507 [Botrytis porri]KAF7903458.1 hypothetical protein EAF01_006507 [Botrytis porri]TGO85965.1 hypothetical protein BPOR_0348g00100 [Botrytis porri]